MSNTEGEQLRISIEEFIREKLDKKFFWESNLDNVPIGRLTEVIAMFIEQRSVGEVTEEDEVTHEKFFGENIKRVKDALFGKMERDENSTTITVPANVPPSQPTDKDLQQTPAALFFETWVKDQPQPDFPLPAWVEQFANDFCKQFNLGKMLFAEKEYSESLEETIAGRKHSSTQGEQGGTGV